MAELRPFGHYTDEQLGKSFDRSDNKVADLVLEDADETLISNNRMVLRSLAAEMDLRGIAHPRID